MAIAASSAALPASLGALLVKFGVEDPHWGAAYDIGRYEGGFTILASPSGQAIQPGGVARYALRLYPTDLPHTVDLTVASPSPNLVTNLDSTLIAPGAVVTLTVTDTGSAPMPGSWYTVPITGTGGGFTQAASVSLLVGGTRTYLPVVKRN